PLAWRSLEPILGTVTKKAGHYARLFSWQERQYDNGTLTDEDFQNCDDVEEIQKLLDDTVEDEPCSE
ncbi:hypothetical protein EB118_19805, partial [bacterium]|nr:hypothetical protein [bacterium]